MHEMQQAVSVQYALFLSLAYENLYFNGRLNKTGRHRSGSHRAIAVESERVLTSSAVTSCPRAAER